MARPGHATDRGVRGCLPALVFCLLTTTPFFAYEAAEAEGLSPAPPIAAGEEFLLAQNPSGGYLKESPYLARRTGEKGAKPTRHPAEPFKPDYHATRRNPSPPKEIKPAKPAGPTHKAAKVNPVEAKVLKILSAQDPIPRPEQWQKPVPVKAAPPPQKAKPTPAPEATPETSPQPEPAALTPGMERKLKGILESGATKPVRRYPKMDPVPVPELAPTFLAMPKPPKPIPVEPEAAPPEEKPAEKPVAEEKPQPKSKALAKIAAAMEALRAQQAEAAPKQETAEKEKAEKEETPPPAQVLRLPPKKQKEPVETAEKPVAVMEPGAYGPSPRFISEADTALLTAAADETRSREKKAEGPKKLLQDAALVSPEMQAQPEKAPKIVARPLPVVTAKVVTAKEPEPAAPETAATDEANPQVLAKIVQAAEKQAPVKEESLSDGDLAWMSRVETQEKKKPAGGVRKPAPQTMQAPKSEPQKLTLGKPIIRRIAPGKPEETALTPPSDPPEENGELLEAPESKKEKLIATPDPVIRRIPVPVAGSEEPARIPPPLPLPVAEVETVAEKTPPGSELSPETRAVLARIPAGIGTPETPKPRKPLAIKRSGTPDMAVEENKVALHDAQGVKIRVEKPRINLNTAMEEGYDALMAGDLGTAMGRYQAVLEQDPKLTEAKFGLATTYHRMGEMVMARDLYSEILASDPENLEVLNNLLVLVSQESPRQALAELGKLAKRNPDYSPIPAQMAAIQAQLRDFSGAINSIRTAIRIDPQNLAYRYNAAVLLDRAGCKDDAIAMYVEIKRAYDRGEDIPADIATIQERLTFLLSNRG